MACILNIETSASICSLALSLDGVLVFSRENTEGLSHASSLGLFVSEALSEIKHRSMKLDAVAVSSGPGSYTGLRIGVSQAKGLCYGLEIPMIGIPTLGLLFDTVLRKGCEADYFCPMIDARRMEVYAEIYDKSAKICRDVAADIVDENTYQEYYSKGSMLLFGDGASKCKDVIFSNSVRYIEDVLPRAENMLALSEAAYAQANFVDTAYFEPFYLKEFMTTQSKRK
ncbi:tRNA(ANN) t(6)A37 threonylcarbamoyladenosine modification protein [Bacteroidales bacterium]|nr:tRNA(ANN) t(6)A37 threonylcarbamoyladenosine modification protein [Bacteroidales bacterium]